MTLDGMIEQIGKNDDKIFKGTLVVIAIVFVGTWFAMPQELRWGASQEALDFKPAAETTGFREQDCAAMRGIWFYDRCVGEFLD